ncbi:MAG: DUF1080 domain-containing protein [Proteobacteria bacterium]|nr:DUF1080 domain-containing protein [Pseudomonadota bacterium]
MAALGRVCSWHCGPVRVLALMACLSGCASVPTSNQPVWTTLLDQSGWQAWNVVGDANWWMEDGSASANSGTGFLISRETYADFDLRVEFWVDAEANSGVFLRCEDPLSITPARCYEVNVFDSRPDLANGTGSIVRVAPASTKVTTSGQWNTFEIQASGDHLLVTLNGVRVVDVRDPKRASGHIALQRAAGAVKIRKVQVRRL